MLQQKKISYNLISLLHTTNTGESHTSFLFFLPRMSSAIAKMESHPSCKCQLNHHSQHNWPVTSEATSPNFPLKYLGKHIKKFKNYSQHSQHRRIQENFPSILRLIQVNCSSQCSVQFTMDREDPLLPVGWISQEKTAECADGFVVVCKMLSPNNFSQPSIGIDKLDTRKWNLICHSTISLRKVKWWAKNTFLLN